MADRADLNKGNKILLPGSALQMLTTQKLNG